MEKDMDVLSMNMKPVNGSIGTASREIVKAKSQATSGVHLSGGQDRSKINHNLMFVADLCDDGHTV